MRTPFAGNIIPANRFDPVAAKVMSLYPTPNKPGITNNNFFSGSNTDDTSQYDGRVDYNLSDSNRIFGRYSRRSYARVNPGPLPMPADGGMWTSTDLTANNVVANWNATLSPTVNNEVRYSYAQTDSMLDIPWTQNLNPELGIQGITSLGDNNARGMTLFNPTGYANLGSRAYWPNGNNLNVQQFSDHVMWVKGTHAVKAGFEFHREEVYRQAARFARGQMNFNGSFTQDPNNRGKTGDGMADFLLGLASGGTLSNVQGETALAHNYSAYLQDDWHVTHRLTLNLGVRWDRFGPPSFPNSQVNRFVLTPGSQNYSIVQPKDGGDCGCEHNNLNFAPRVGLAYQATAKTVIRSGFGIFYGEPDSLQSTGGRFFNQAPDYSEIGFPTDRLLQPGLVVSRGFPAGLFPATSVLANTAISTAFTSIPTQYSMQWFYDVQRELPFDTVLTLSYIGAATRHQVWNLNINQPLTPAPGGK
ncbi:MAG: TonB-dependent receptor, partial [Acidobacteria bacterium]|nr:TonB-dependent receptor [Acidobacteriota bacterium]